MSGPAHPVGLSIREGTKVYPGTVMYEIDGVEEDQAREEEEKKQGEFMIIVRDGLLSHRK